MAKILFTWEIGEGSGHIAPYINLIKLLEQQGHTVFFALKNLGNASGLLKDTRTIYLQAPTLLSPLGDLLKPIDSYPKILHNSGYSRVPQITSLIKAWQNLFKLVDPDLLILDYSPTAMLASLELPIKRLQIGTGFYVPTDTCPITGLETLQGNPQDIDKLIAFENGLLTKINTALTSLDMQPIKKIADIQRADQNMLLSFQELDHYPSRPDASYLGVFKAPAGLKPEWPDQPGPRVFMYLKPFPTLQAFLQILNEKKLPTLIYPDGISDRIKRQFTSETLRFVDKPLDMKTIGETATVAVCNGNHGTSAELLLSGIPILLVPLQAEQNITARNIERMGAGLSAPKKHPASMGKKLDALINDPRYRQAAQAFAQRYSEHTNEKVNARVLHAITNLLNGKV